MVPQAGQLGILALRGASWPGSSPHMSAEMVVKVSSCLLRLRTQLRTHMPAGFLTNTMLPVGLEPTTYGS